MNLKYDSLLRHLSLNILGSRLVTPPLDAVAFEPTNHCNLNCKTCFSHGRKQGFMDMELFNNRIKEVLSYRRNLAVSLNFGGEPLLHKHFTDMVSAAASLHPSSIGFITNGLLFNKATGSAVKALPKWSVAFSIDGLEESYHNIRGGDYGKLLNNIAAFTQDGRNGSGVVGVNLVKFGQSDQEIHDYIDYWCSRVDYVAVGECLNSDLEIISKDTFIEDQLSNRRVCSWSFRYMGVLWDGGIVKCCHDLAGKTRARISAVESSLEDIWCGEEYREIRLQHIRKEFPKGSVCRSCEAWVAPYLNIPPRRLSDGVTVWRHGICTYYTRNPASLGLRV